MATRASKYSSIINWILNNVTLDEMKQFDSKQARCQHVISRIPSELLTIIPTTDQLYHIIYKYKLIPAKLEGNKSDRINWLQQHKDEIMNISYPTSKQTNKSRIEFTMEHMNKDLGMNYPRDSIRNFLNHQGWLMRHHQY
jgi:hypothetical protein